MKANTKENLTLEVKLQKALDLYEEGHIYSKMGEKNYKKAISLYTQATNILESIEVETLPVEDEVRVKFTNELDGVEEMLRNRKRFFEEEEDNTPIKNQARELEVSH